MGKYTKIMHGEDFAEIARAIYRGVWSGSKMWNRSFIGYDYQVLGETQVVMMGFWKAALLGEPLHVSVLVCGWAGQVSVTALSLEPRSMDGTGAERRLFAEIAEALAYYPGQEEIAID